MRLHRFFVDADLSRSSLKITDPGLLHQWNKVLRLQGGDSVVLCDGKSLEAKGTLKSIERDHATVALGSPAPVTAEPKRHVTLYCSILKRENFEWVVQKCTELGIKTIVPVITGRTVKTGLKMERLRIIAKEAAEQSGRGIIPIISEPVEFDRACLSGRQALEEAKRMINIFYDCPHLPSAQPFSHLGIQQSTSRINKQSPKSIAIWIGPEGGWTDDEVVRAKECGFAIRSLGFLILRAETAAIIGSYTAIQGLEY